MYAEFAGVLRLFVFVRAFAFHKKLITSHNTSLAVPTADWAKLESSFFLSVH